jgi:hypothetical protein|uniref:DUF5683 domain-containing protein n=1 Tax=Desulfobacca acetoxidans TaxID=60893 RepID=A0A7C5AKS1_9BACT
MRPGIKAFLLSALVFPGLGQLYKQDRAKGVILLLLANLLLAFVLLMGVMYFSQEYLTSVYPAPLTGESLRLLVPKVLARPGFYLPGLVFLMLWGFAAADALLTPSPPQKDEP